MINPSVQKINSTTLVIKGGYKCNKSHHTILNLLIVTACPCP